MRRFNYILLGPDGRNMLGLSRSIGEAGGKNITALVLSTPTPQEIIYSRYVKECVYINSLEDGVRWIKEHVQTGPSDKTFIFTSSDDAQSILDDNYDTLKDIAYFGNCGYQGALKKWFDKAAQNELAIECGLNVPQTEEVTRGDMPRVVHYPIITKALDSLQPGWKNNVHICRNEAELLEAYGQIKSNRILLQEYVEREYETKFDTLMYNGELLKNIPQCFDYEFSDMAYGSHHLYKSLQNNELLDAAEKMLNRIGFQGLVQIEFMKGKNGKVYFLEINFRHSGVGYVSTCCGVNLPQIYVQSIINKNLFANDIKLCKLPKQTINDLPDMEHAVKKLGMSPIKWFITRYFKADISLLWNWHDIKPGLIVWFSFIKYQLTKRF